MMRNERGAALGMVVVTILWGANFVTGKVIMDTGMSAGVYTAWRFVLAALLLLVLFRKRFKEVSLQTYKVGALIGLAVGVGYILQTVGLSLTTASKAGFLTGLYVVLVPLLDSLFKRSWIRRNEGVGVCLALIGLMVLSLESGFKISIGDVIVFLSAVSFALSIVWIGKYSKFHDPAVLATIQIFITGLIGLGLAICSKERLCIGDSQWVVVVLLVYAVLFGTAVNTVVQTYAQRMLSPTTAALILILEPVFAGVFGYIFLHEPLGLKELMGSALIIGGMLITLLWKGSHQKENILP